MNDKTMILYYDNGNKPIFTQCFIDSGVRCRSWLNNELAYQLYIIFNHIRRIRSLFKNFFYYFPGGMEGLIILFDTKLSDGLYYKTIKSRNPDAKIIKWYWNAVNSGFEKNRTRNMDEWSYSPLDCGKYGLLYNPQFYFDSIVESHRDIRDQREMQGEKSFIFMGREKGRANQVAGIADEIKKCGWGCDIDYLSTSRSDRPRTMDVAYIPGFTYDKYVEKMLNYQGILDIAFKENSGLSLRTMESIFFHKKLITDNPIVTYYEFYDENNIYVWGHSKISLEEFLARPYRPVPDSICETYLLSSWIKRLKKYYDLE